MPDKPRERYYLAELRQALGTIPNVPAAEPDPPDFVVDDGGTRLGIEVTGLYLPPALGRRPHEERRSLQERTVEHAEAVHAQAGGPALYVDVFFDSTPLRKRDTRPLGEAIAAAVLRLRPPRSIAEGPAEVAWDELPRSVTKIVAWASVDGRDRLWQAEDAEGWAAPIEPEHIRAVIAKKARRAARARAACDSLWLVIVSDAFSLAAPAQLGPAALEATYAHPFDRLIFLVPHAHRAVDLRGGEVTLG